ncbi:MAG: hypothetical protein HQL32_01115 [Planctomycetes bacterium]|nr:hypothetical protein [Planctomycetota bacterium]
MPKFWVKHGLYYHPDFTPLATGAPASMILAAYGWCLGGQVLAQLLVSYLMSLLSAATILLISRQFWTLRGGLISCSIFIFMPVISLWLVHASKVSLSACVFELQCLYLIITFLSKEKKSLILAYAGLFLGFAAGSSYGALPSVFIISVCLPCYLIKHIGLRQTIHYLLYFLIPLALVLCIFFLYNCYHYYSPFYPVIRLSHFISGIESSHSLNATDIKEFKTHADGVLGIFRYLYLISTNIYLPNTRGCGPIILLAFFMSISLNINKLPRHISFLILLSLFAFCLNYNLHQRPRHILTFLGLIAICAAGMRSEGHLYLKKYIQRTLFFMLILWNSVVILLIILNMDRFNMFLYAGGSMSRSAFLEFTYDQIPTQPNYKIVSYINKNIPSDQSILLCNLSRNSLYLNNPVYSNRDSIKSEDLVKHDYLLIRISETSGNKQNSNDLDSLRSNSDLIFKYKGQLLYNLKYYNSSSTNNQ